MDNATEATPRKQPRTAAAAAAAIETVKMVRPEDLQPEPCVVEVEPGKVDGFKAEGWVVKTDAEIAEMKQRNARPAAEPEGE